MHDLKEQLEQLRVAQALISIATKRCRARSLRKTALETVRKLAIAVADPDMHSNEEVEQMNDDANVSDFARANRIDAALRALLNELAGASAQSREDVVCAVRKAAVSANVGFVLHAHNIATATQEGDAR